jgi:hypothetical protein
MSSSKVTKQACLSSNTPEPVFNLLVKIQNRLLNRSDQFNICTYFGSFLEPSKMIEKSCFSKPKPTMMILGKKTRG